MKKILYKQLFLLFILLSVIFHSQSIVKWQSGQGSGTTGVSTDYQGTATVAGQTVTVKVTATTNLSTGFTYQQPSANNNIIFSDDIYTGVYGTNTGEANIANNFGVGADEWFYTRRYPNDSPPNILTFTFTTPIPVKIAEFGIGDLDASTGFNESMKLSGTTFGTPTYNSGTVTPAPTVTNNSVTFSNITSSGNAENFTEWYKFPGTGTLNNNSTFTITFTGASPNPSATFNGQANILNAWILKLAPACNNPSITTQATSTQTVLQNATPTELEVVASGDTTLSYQWYSNTTNSTTGGTAISGATNFKYTPPTTAPGTVYYYVVVTNSCGTTTSAISTVTVLVDSDGDGITDINDIDDDNDGIVDCTETAGNVAPNYNTPATTSVTTNGVTKLTNFELSTYIKINADKTSNDTSTRSPDRDQGYANGDFTFGVNTTSGTQVAEYTFTYTHPVDIIISQGTDALSTINFDSGETYKITTVGGTLAATAPNISYATSNLTNQPELINITGNNTNVLTFNPAAKAATNVPKATSQWTIVAKGVTSITFNWTSQSSTNARSKINIAYTCVDKDTDGDGIPDRLDLDSDNDGCPDAVEGGANIFAGDLKDASGTLQGGNTGATSGTYNKPLLKNICTTCVSTSGANIGLPQISGNNAAGVVFTGYNNNDTVNPPLGQSVGTSTDGVAPAGCVFCYKPALATGTELPAKHGITALGRAGKSASPNASATQPDNWPMVRTGAWTVLESKSKGFVLNRMPVAAATSGTTYYKGEPMNAAGTAAVITSPVIGMTFYDTTNNCIRINTDGTRTGWRCFDVKSCPTNN